MAAESTDGDLVGLTRGGDTEAYGTLVARYQGHVYGLAYSLVGNWADAQDIAQETFIRAYVNLDQLREPPRFAAWLRRVTFSVAMRWLKAFRPGLFKQLDGQVDLDSLEIPDFRPGPPEVVERRELAEAVQRAIASLPPKYRVPLTMFHLDGLSYDKVADFLDIPLGTAKSLIHRARAKLKGALATYAAEEITPVVQEVFDEHKLPAEFARKVLEKVPTLGWGRGRECTFAGALEAALAVTKHPYSYTDIMGFTGLAFRVRWFCGNERGRWCPSSAVGEMPEAAEAFTKATGWPIRWGFLAANDPSNVERLTAEIMASIDAGRPVLAYEPRLNMDVVYGYEDGGKMLLLRDYFQGEDPLRLPPSKLGFLIAFVGERGKALSHRAAVIEGLRIAVRNWKRERHAEGPGEYWYGAAAFARWIEDLADGKLSTDEKKLFHHVNWWNFNTMADARRAAVAFLREASGGLNGDAGAALSRAADLYEQESDLFGQVFASKDAFLSPSSGKSLRSWTARVRRREQEILSEARKIEDAAISEIEKALAAIA
ncbi:MAG: sigma-70 family RNA polymerase sigma factor [Armatimonadota bacterium]|nr:MAG: sigma-70 family RNA polymerase sigma factor [Armatimonadota bacterium]